MWNSVTHSSKKKNQCDFEAKEKWWHAESICTLWWGHEFQRIYEIVRRWRRVHLWWWRGKEWWSCVLTGGCREKRRKKKSRRCYSFALLPTGQWKIHLQCSTAPLCAFHWGRWRDGHFIYAVINRWDCTSLALRPSASGAKTILTDTLYNDKKKCLCLNK